jgi:hypothetical protein
MTLACVPEHTSPHSTNSRTIRPIGEEGSPEHLKKKWKKKKKENEKICNLLQTDRSAPDLFSMMEHTCTASPTVKNTHSDPNCSKNPDVSNFWMTCDPGLATANCSPRFLVSLKSSSNEMSPLVSMFVTAAHNQQPHTSFNATVHGVFGK